MKLTSFFLASASLPALADLSPNQLKCEYSDNPQDIDNPQPRLTWILECVEASSEPGFGENYL